MRDASGADEGEETLTLKLSAPFGAQLSDAQAVGTIANSDPVPKAWLARFGRTVAGHVTDAIAGRFEAAGAGSQVVLGGQRLSPASDAAPAAAGQDGAAAWDGSPGADGVRTVTARELLLGSSFLLAGGSDAAGGGAAGRTAWAAWGRAAASQFEGAADGVALDGDVITFMLGADVAWDRWLAGAALAHSIGDGGYRDQGGMADEAGSGGGTLEVTLTSIHPYVRVQASERISLWAVLGYGAGELTLTPDTAGGPESAKAATQMGMAAAGARGELVSARDTGGCALAAQADAQFVHTSSAQATGAGTDLAATQAATSRLRLVLEGAYRVEFRGRPDPDPGPGGGRALRRRRRGDRRRHRGGRRAGLRRREARPHGGGERARPARARGRGLRRMGRRRHDPLCAGRRRGPRPVGERVEQLGRGGRRGGTSVGGRRRARPGAGPGLRTGRAPGGGGGLGAGGLRRARPDDAGGGGWRSRRQGGGPGAPASAGTLGPDLAFGVEGTMHEAAGGGAAEPGIELQATARW